MELASRGYYRSDWIAMSNQTYWPPPPAVTDVLQYQLSNQTYWPPPPVVTDVLQNQLESSAQSSEPVTDSATTNSHSSLSNGNSEDTISTAQSVSRGWIAASNETYWKLALPATNIPQNEHESPAQPSEPVTNSSATTSRDTISTLPRPVSSYSIASLLGHNNNNNSIKNDASAFGNTGSPVQFHQTPHKSSIEKSPSNNSIRTPSLSRFQNNYNCSPSTSSLINYGGNNHSSDWCPSPEHTYARYRPYNVRNPPSSAELHPYPTVSSQGSSSCSSASALQPPPSAGFHPYPSVSSPLQPPSSAGFHPHQSVSSLGSSSCSSASELQPPSSAGFHPYQLISSQRSSSCSSATALQPSSSSGLHPYPSVSSQVSQSLPYSQYATSGYSEISPQHFGSNKLSMHSTSFTSSSTNKSKAATSTSIETEFGHNIKSIIGGSSSRTVTTENSEHLEQYGSPVSSVNTETKTNKIVYNPISNNESSKKDSDQSGTKSIVSSAGSASSPEVSNQQINTANNTSALSQEKIMDMLPPRTSRRRRPPRPPRPSQPPRPVTPPPVIYDPLGVARFYSQWIKYATTPPPARLYNSLHA